MKKITLQALVCLVTAAGVYLMRPLPFVYAAGRWALLPACGAVSAYIIVRKGVNPYAAWIAPPLALTLGAFAVSGGYLPGFGWVLLEAFASVAGAGFGDARNNFARKGHR